MTHPHGLRGYLRATYAAARIAATPLGKRVLFLGILALLPALIPILVALSASILPREHISESAQGLDLYTSIAEYGFLGTLAPLAAIFLATALVGENVENGTAAYLLTRGAPRSALVLGNLAAYSAVVAGVLLPAMVLTYAGATLTMTGAAPTAGIPVLASTFGIVVLAVVAYGALCCTLGSVVKRPVVWAASFVFGWEPLTRIVPGYVDFFTIKKHLLALWPVVVLGGDPGAVEVGRRVIDVGRGEAALILSVVLVFFAAASTFVLREKEFARGQNLA